VASPTKDHLESVILDFYAKVDSGDVPGALAHLAPDVEIRWNNDGGTGTQVLLDRAAQIAQFTTGGSLHRVKHSIVDADALVAAVETEVEYQRWDGQRVIAPAGIFFWFSPSAHICSYHVCVDLTELTSSGPRR
jgi:hypothetical protein